MMVSQATQIKVILLFFSVIRLIEAFIIRQVRFQRECRVWSEDERRSIGDVVKGLHGSKYQFGAAGINYEGQQFAEMSYSSGTLEEDDYEDGPPPNWALSLQQKNPPEGCPELFVSKDGAVVEIQNDERSWEKYYAFVIGDEDCCPYYVAPRVGMLAPRGGSNDYTDTAQVAVHVTDSTQGNWWLVVGTEAASWSYKIV
jgi:hypothetical protein